MFLSLCMVITRTIALFAILANLALLPLIWYRSSRELGFYSWFLFVYTLVGLLFSVIIIVGAPVFGPSEQGWILYASSVNLPQDQGWWIIVMYCFCYAAELLILAVSFVYRYFYVCRPQSLIWFRSKCRISFVLTFLVTIAFIWTGLTIMYLSPNQELNDIFALSVYNNSRLPISNVSYIAGIAFKDGELVLCFFGIFLFRFTVIMGSAAVVIFCAIRISLALAEVHSGNTNKRLAIRAQRKLFALLIAQTIIPLLLIYVPAVSSYVIAFFRLDAPNLTMFYTVLMPLAQLVDPLLIIFFVADYRRPTCAIMKKMANIANYRLRQRVSDCSKMKF